MSKYSDQGLERPLSPEDLGDDDQPPVEWNRKRRFALSKTYGAVIDSYRFCHGLPPIETEDL